MYKICCFLLLGFALTSVIASPVQSADEKKLVCYYGSWAVYRPGNGKFDVEHIDPFACTHIIYGFVGLSASNEIEVMDTYNDLEENWGRGAMKRFTNLKAKNSKLKALVAIGGWNEGSEKYSKMAMDPAKRQTFVKSVVPFLQSQNFDGLDVDWEYPANREGAAPEDKENFVLLLNELRAELEPHGYLLTAAVAAGVKTMATAYDIPAVSRALDFINVMAYDFHGSWEPFTGHNSPLYGNKAIDHYDNITLNTDYSIRYWIDQGADPEKLILGIGTYGQGFVLDNPENNGLYAPARNPITAGPYTRQAGMWGYNEISEKFSLEEGQWTIVNDQVYQVPYAYNGVKWIGYDSVQSAYTKAQYATANGLGGGMVWSIETDDFLGLFHNETFPIIRAISRGLLGGNAPTPAPSTTTDASNTNPTTSRAPTNPPETTRAPTNPPETTTRAPETTSGVPTSSQQPPSDICREEGMNPDPSNDCTPIFYVCISHNGQWIVHANTCAQGTIFNPVRKECDHAFNVPSCT